ncbi:hypothetical protein ABPG74_007205 [Tetrahymena malaccensis]
MLEILKDLDYFSESVQFNASKQRLKKRTFLGAFLSFAILTITLAYSIYLSLLYFNGKFQPKFQSQNFVSNDEIQIQLTNDLIGFDFFSQHSYNYLNQMQDQQNKTYLTNVGTFFNHISQQISPQQLIAQDQQIGQIKHVKQEGIEKQEDQDTKSEEKIEAESKDNILIPQFQTKLRFTSNFLSQKINQNDKEDIAKYFYSQIKPKNEEKTQLKELDNLSHLTYQQQSNFKNLSYQDQSPNLIKFDSYQGTSQPHSPENKEKLIQMTSSITKQKKIKQKLTKPNKSTLKKIIIQIQQQIDDSLDYFKFFKEVLFLKKVALVLLSKDQLAAIQLVGIDIQDIEPKNHKIQHDLQEIDPIDKRILSSLIINNEI